MKSRMKVLGVIGLVFAAATSAGSAEPKASGQTDGWKRGRSVYVSSCSACHNPDPSKDGALGPAVLGSSKDLLEALLLRGEYPANYKPKRPTKTMPPLPFLEPEIPYLAAYLSSGSKGD